MNVRYKVRLSGVLFIFFMLWTVVLVNLYVIQIKRHSFFTNLGKKQYHRTVIITPPRACIYDRSGKPLALNKESYAAFIMPDSLVSPDEMKTFLSEHFPPAAQRLAKNPTARFQYIARKLTDEQKDLITQKNYPDVHLLKEPNRFYPEPSAGHFIGITNVDNHGLFGIEQQYNKQLAGSPAEYLLQKDARSRMYHFSKQTKAQQNPGKPVQLTIDRTLQFLTHEALQETVEKFNAQEGSVVIINPDNGEILAMVTYPTFDPNNTKELRIADTKNRIISDTYEFGSVIKVFAALAALEEGVVTPDELIDCEDVQTTYINGRKVNTVRSSIIGTVPFSRVIEKSNNIGIAKVMMRLDDLLYDHYRRLGFGDKVNIGLPGEQEGFVNPPGLWSKQSIFSLSYGYEISATLLQLARAFCIIANGGYAIEPKLFKDQKTSPKVRLYSQEAIKTLKHILENTVLHGTAYRSRIPGYRVLGKTGTANLLVDGNYSYAHNIFTHTGSVEKDNYRRVIITFVKEVPGRRLYASTVATPLFETVAQRMLIHDKIL